MILLSKDRPRDCGVDLTFDDLLYQMCSKQICKKCHGSGQRRFTTLINVNNLLIYLLTHLFTWFKDGLFPSLKQIGQIGIDNQVTEHVPSTSYL